MSRHLLVVLLLATGVALADQKPEAKDAAGTAEAEVKTEAVRGQTEEMQPTTKAAQESTAEAQAATTKVQGRTEAAEVKTQAVPEGALAKTKAAQERAADPQANMEEAQGRTEAAQAQADKDGKLISVPGGKALGMSVLGNQEAPTSLVIVPWKSSEVGRSPGISPMLDDSRQPVDKEVFMRALRYYEIRSETKP
jgi:type IV secretory pathway VirB10-like protein